MTIQKTSFMVEHVAAGGTEFFFQFRVDAAEDMKIALNGVEIVSGYSLNLNPGSESGGSVNFETAPDTGTIVSIRRELPLVQLSKYFSGTKFPAKTVELDQDDDRMIDQQLADWLSRSLSYGPYSGLDAYQAGDRRISGLAYGTDPTDAISVDQARNDPNVGSGLPGPAGPASPQNQYELTPSEEKSGLTDADIDKEVLPGWITRYFASGAGQLDSVGAMQKALNAASWAHDDSSHPNTVYGPSGDYVFNDDLYGYYDADNNPTYNPAAGFDGRWRIHGDGCPDYAAGTQDRRQNTLFRFNPGFKFKGSSSGSASKQIVIMFCGFWGDVDGDLVEIGYAPELLIDHVSIYNASETAGVGGLYVEDAWIGNIRNVWITGPDRNQASPSAAPAGTRTTAWGAGVRYRSAAAGGGNMKWSNVNVNGFGDSFDLGSDYATDVKSVSNHEFYMCQAQYCQNGFIIKAGMGNVVFDTCFVEFIMLLTGDRASGYWVHESAGKRALDATTNRDGRITLRNCLSGTSEKPTDRNANARLDLIRLGSDEANVDRSAFGNVHVDNHYFGQLNTNVRAIRVFNSEENGFCKIKDPVSKSNGGRFLVLEDEAQHGLVELIGTEGLKWIPQSNWVVNTSNNERSRWLGGRSTMAAELPSGAASVIDYNQARGLAEELMARPSAGSTQTIKLPSNTRMQNVAVKVTDLNFGSDGQILLDASAPAWQGTTYYKRGSIVSKGGWLFACTIPGLTGGSGPVGGSGDAQVDGTATWRDMFEGDHSINGRVQNPYTSEGATTVQLLLTSRGLDDSNARGIEWFVSELTESAGQTADV